MRLMKGMVMGLISGKQELFMKGNGIIIRHMEKAYFGIVLVKYILVNSNKIRQMAMVFIFIKMDLDMRESGKWIYKKGKVLKLGMMALDMKEHINKG